MRKRISSTSAIVCLVFLIYGMMMALSVSANPFRERNVIKLPAPATSGTVSVEAAMQARKSIRSYAYDPLRLRDVSQLLWAAQGITRKNGMRTAPSAGALYPLEVYLVVGHVQDLTPGVYRYRPHEHELERLSSDDRRRELTRAALHQSCIEKGAVDIVLAAVYERTAGKYGSRAERYVHMEAGHAAQNIYLQATSLGLATVMVGAFNDQAVQQTLLMNSNEYPLCIMPVGRIR